VISREAWHIEAAGLDKELERLLVLLEKGDLDPQEFSRQFRRVRNLPASEWLEDKVVGEEIVRLYTLAWFQAKKREYDYIADLVLRLNRVERSLDRPVGRLDDVLAERYLREQGVDPATEEETWPEEVSWEAAYQAARDRMPEFYHGDAAWGSLSMNESDLLMFGQMGFNENAIRRNLGKPVTFNKRNVDSEAEAETLLQQAVELVQRVIPKWIEEASASFEVATQLLGTDA
jgi:hypothetical protein